jgi:restriction endonuclease Mrr
MVNTKEAITMELTDKYLQECLDRVYSADPTGEELVINDLKARMGYMEGGI